MTRDQALTIALDARDAVHKARRALKALKVFCPQVYRTMCEADDSLAVMIHEHLALRQQGDAAPQKVAA